MAGAPVFTVVGLVMLATVPFIVEDFVAVDTTVALESDAVDEDALADTLVLLFDAELVVVLSLEKCCTSTVHRKFDSNRLRKR